jgi:hypothetical protein
LGFGSEREGDLAELHAISSQYDDVDTHVVFVHGLSGDVRRTWTSNVSKSEVLWPTWLAEDVPRLGVWLVGYPAAKTNWAGHALPLSDRADNVLSRLLVEPRLGRGNVIFVAHSLGGLVVEQLVRNAQRDSGSTRAAEDLLSRVRRVAFLGTPHRGSMLANVATALSPFLRPSAATRDLPFDGPQLRDLNFWYRKFSKESGIDNLMLVEGRPEKVLGFSLPKWLGTVVWASSADAGLPELPLTVDESHTTICKPASRESDVYVQLREFIGRPFAVPPRATRAVEAVERNTRELEGLSARSKEQTDAIEKLAGRLSQHGPVSVIDTTVLDSEVARQVDRLRKCRLFVGFNAVDEARRLVASVREGSLAFASSAAKDEALVWCARLMSAASPDEASRALAGTASPNPELATVAAALIAQSQGRFVDALADLATFNTPISHGAALLCILRDKGLLRATAWLHECGLTFNDLDSDGKFFYLGSALEGGAWTIAFEAVTSLTDADFERTPALRRIAADAHLTHAIPDELRVQALRYVPMDAANFPLRSEPENLVHRRTAAALYESAQSAAQILALSAASGEAGDRGLWLRLMDPITAAEARIDLAASLKDPATLLRRMNLALKFGIEIDLQQVEKEVDRQTALSGGTSPDAAMARFALAFSQKGYTAAAEYVNRHRGQLLDHLDWRAVYFFEIEALAKAGQAAQAEVRLQEAVARGATQDEADRLRRLLLEVKGGDPIAVRLEAFTQSQSLVDLRLLADALTDGSHWSKVAEFGKTLLDRTGDIADARRYVISLYKLERREEVLAVLAAYPALPLQFERMHLLRAQTLYELGRLEEARELLGALPDATRSAESRHLEVSIAVASGDWESLQAFVEREWTARGERSATELVRAGRLAHLVGAARGQDLVREAAQRGLADPVVLLGCYEAATSAGWEVSRQASQWLLQAAALSEGGDGPVQRMTIEDAISRRPDWERREAEAWQLLSRGEIPIFAAGQALNRSLLSLFLEPSIGNSNELDVRKRPIVYAFSGARGVGIANPSTVAMDPTALVSAELLDVLDICISTFTSIVIPHGTLGWLLEEYARISFHQPSRVAAARNLRRLIAEGALQVFDDDTIAPESLVGDVGEPLASLLTCAVSADDSDLRQRVVVKGGPIHKVSTFMRDEVDATPFEGHLCSTVDVVAKLEEKGVLTVEEAEECREALSVRERTWPAAPAIADGALVYLDEVSVAHLDFLGLLPKLRRGGFTAIVSPRAVEEADALISYDARSEDVQKLVDQLRSRVRAALASGKIRLGKALRVPEDEGSRAFLAHPSVAMLQLVDDADACVSDDRFVNQHATVTSGSGGVPLLTTLDVLDLLQRQGAISARRRQEARTKLRRAGYALVPIEQAELSSLVESAPVIDGVLTETGELRAVRESIQRVRMTNVLQVPKEVIWLNGVIGSVLHVLKEQWRLGVDEGVAQAKSDWLLALGDVRGWTHRLAESAQQLEDRYRSWLALLMTLPATRPESVREAYWRWFTARIFDPIAKGDPETHTFLIRHARDLILRLVDESEQDLKVNHV